MQFGKSNQSIGGESLNQLEVSHTPTKDVEIVGN